MSLKKTASVESPHARFVFGDWEWRVLKTYKKPENERNDDYARWFCHVTSPFVPESELGDVYIHDIDPRTIVVYSTDEWKKAYYDN